MFLDKFEKRNGETNINEWSTIYNSENGYDFSENGLRESTYYKCIKYISESVAKIPLHLKKSDNIGEIKAINHILYNLLRYRPNPYMSSLDFWKCLEARRQHNGDAFALIIRDSKGIAKELYPIDVVRLVVDNVGLCKSSKKNKVLVEYQVEGRTYNCLYSEVIHLKSFTLDGLNSKPVRKVLNDLIDTNKSSLSYQKELFKNGLTSKALVQMVSDIKDEKELVKVQAKFNRLFSAKGRVLTVPAGFNVTPLNLSLADSQFEQLKKLNAIDLATAFGVPPYLLGYMDGYNNNSLEQSNLSFLNSTLLVLLQSIEQELNYKLLSDNERKQGYYFEFNQNVLLRTDSKSQSEILTKYVASGIYTPNEARELLGFNRYEDGDDLIVNSGVLKLKDITKSKEEVIEE